MENLLSQSEFYILLSLAIDKRHGYEIMKQVKQESGGKVLLGPGTLYGSIKRMLEAEMVEEVKGDNPRRKYYMLTEKGKKALSSELERYQDAVELARQNKVFENLGLIKLSYL
jgi:DNA-binding PadR family transcriptional regulator